MSELIPSKNAIELIKRFEGLRLKSYEDVVGIYTIGYGTTMINGKKVELGLTCTKEDAEKWLYQDLVAFSKNVNKLIKISITQNQFDALCSFAYNLGLESLSKSSLLKLVNTNPNDAKIDVQFMRWNKAGGKIVNGLTRRRKSESWLYSKNELKFFE